eukprot:CAMPEP_0115483622 /NCGR_PEP_ID=MMETSP0271-20121206/58950_1 /TAXON_ID=71861 /ORGANISM="Scrippsiella trochoidea, Strain CCMP3099" /LENGTH=231 /DNA_ID=CAMNT_0002911477 /DNA_START=76 /DNA_END=768 /DNA_ORIENTATION=-
MPEKDDRRLKGRSPSAKGVGPTSSLKKTGKTGSDNTGTPGNSANRQIFGAGSLNGAGSCSVNKSRFGCCPEMLPLPSALSAGRGPTAGLDLARRFAIARRDRDQTRNHAGPLPRGTGTSGGTPSSPIGSPSGAIGSALPGFGDSGGGSAISGGVIDGSTLPPGGGSTMLPFGGTAMPSEAGFADDFTLPRRQEDTLDDEAFAKEMAALEEIINVLGEQLRAEAFDRVMDTS